ncbi:unnamed protein product, partial [Ascophyllum nodosum]
MDDSDPTYRESVQAVALFLRAQGDWRGARALWRRLLASDEKQLEADRQLMLRTLEKLSECTDRMGDAAAEAARLRQNEWETLPLVLAKDCVDADSSDNQRERSGTLEALALATLRGCPEESALVERLLKKALVIEGATLGTAGAKWSRTRARLTS